MRLGVVCHAEFRGRSPCGFSSRLAWPDTNAFLAKAKQRRSTRSTRSTSLLLGRALETSASFEALPEPDLPPESAGWIIRYSHSKQLRQRSLCVGVLARSTQLI